MLRFLIVTFSVFSLFLNSQTTDLREKCSVKETFFKELLAVNDNTVKCLAKNSDKSKTIFFTFARWCAPCMYHLNDFMALEENYDVDLYVLLVDKENHHFTDLARKYVSETFPKAKIAIIGDVPGRGRSKKYKDFMDAITPSKFEKIDDMSKYIVINKTGEVELVTSWKDSKGDPDWTDSKPMINRLIVPLISKK